MMEGNILQERDGESEESKEGKREREGEAVQEGEGGRRREGGGDKMDTKATIMREREKGVHLAIEPEICILVGHLL